MLHRIREGLASETRQAFAGPVEVDETYVGGKEANKHASKRLHVGGGTGGKMAVVAAKDRDSNQVVAEVIENVNGGTLTYFVDSNASPETMVYTDGSTVYKGRKNHEAVKHSMGEYVRGMAHTNGVESFLEHVEAGLPWHVSPDERKALAAVCERIRRTAQYPGHGHRGPDGPCCRWHGRTAVAVPGPDQTCSRHGKDGGMIDPQK